MKPLTTPGPIRRHDHHRRAGQHMPFEEVAYWETLPDHGLEPGPRLLHASHLLGASRTVPSLRIPKHSLPRKVFGVFPHSMSYTRPVKLFRGFDDVFYVPHSRHTEIRREDILAVPGLRLLSESPLSGVYAVSDMTGRQIFLTGHSEYDPGTLRDEYERDLAGLHRHRTTIFRRRSRPAPRFLAKLGQSGVCELAQLLCAYQMTPFNLEHLAASGMRRLRKRRNDRKRKQTWPSIMDNFLTLRAAKAGHDRLLYAPVRTLPHGRFSIDRWRRPTRTARRRKANVDDESGIAQRYRVMTFRTVMIFKAGQPVETVVGARSYDDLNPCWHLG